MAAKSLIKFIKQAFLCWRYRREHTFLLRLLTRSGSVCGHGGWYRPGNGCLWSRLLFLGNYTGTVAQNPFLNLPNASPVATRDRVLTDEELLALWRATGDTSLPYGAIVRILMMTG